MLDVFSLDYPRLPNPRYLYNVLAKGVSGTTAAQVGVANRAWLTAIEIPANCEVDQLNIEVTTNGGVGTSLRLALFKDAGFKPDAASLIAESGNIAADGGAGIRTWNLAQPVLVQPGYVWAALLTADTTIQFRRMAILTSTNEASGERVKGTRFDNGSFGNFTDPCPTTTGDSIANFICQLRVSRWFGR